MLKTVSPITNSCIIETAEATQASVDQALLDSEKAYLEWSAQSLDERKALIAKFLAALEAKADELGLELTNQMGRPIQYTPGEIKTAAMRGRVLLEYADEALARRDVDLDNRPAFTKYLTKESLGVTFIIFPWNYPYLCLVNGLIPSLLAGNSCLIKPSPQTPQVADTIVSLFEAVGAPKSLVQAIHSGDNTLVANLVKNKKVQAVSFTGSVEGGLAIQLAASEGRRTIPIGLELGGNDAAYVCADADLASTAENIADGALFNSGQSCCSIERVYVHESIYDQFKEEVIKVVKNYTVGDPRKPGFSLGPLVSEASAKRVKAQVAEALASGAVRLVDEPEGIEELGACYVFPQVLENLPADSPILMDETFGPVLPLVKVKNDEEAIELINDSQFGLTASVWSPDSAKAEEIANKLDAGTVFVNRCDFPDPHLAWTGYRYSGRGVSLSPYGFSLWYKVKSHHIKH